MGHHSFVRGIEREGGSGKQLVLRSSFANERFEFRDENPVAKRVKYRVLFAPNEAMKVLHQRCLHHLRSFWLHRRSEEALAFATALQPGDSSMGNVEPHRQNRYFFLLDLKDAFPSVNLDKLVEALLAVDPEAFLGHRKALKQFLETYFFDPAEGLMIGGPASGDLFNLYAGVLIDRELGGLCKEWGLTYTRYVDDLTFSSDKEIDKPKRQEIRGIIGAAGFTVNEWKAGIYDLKKKPIVITGIGLEFGGRVFLPRGCTRKILGLLHRARVRGDVDPSVVHGTMSVFFSVTGRETYRMNRIERRVVREYVAFRREVRTR